MDQVWRWRRLGQGIRGESSGRGTRRYTIGAAVAAVVLVLCGCVPQRTGGFPGSYDGTRQSIVVGDIPGVNGDQQALDATWNKLVGWPMLVRGDNPQIMFHTMSPADLARYPDTPAMAYAGDGAACLIVTNPQMEDWQTEYLFLHEIGHCLGFPDVDDCDNPLRYRGVMSSCGFWTDWSGWWGADDAEMVHQAGVTDDGRR